VECGTDRGNCRGIGDTLLQAAKQGSGGIGEHWVVFGGWSKDAVLEHADMTHPRIGLVMLGETGSDGL
jgi:hypothetical protein